MTGIPVLPWLSLHSLHQHNGPKLNLRPVFPHKDRQNAMTAKKYSLAGVHSLCANIQGTKNMMTHIVITLLNSGVSKVQKYNFKAAVLKYVRLKDRVLQ